MDGLPAEGGMGKAMGRSCSVSEAELITALQWEQTLLPVHESLVAPILLPSLGPSFMHINLPLLYIYMCELTAYALCNAEITRLPVSVLKTFCLT